ncbi:MAG: hypothetical protein ACYDC5_05275 [Candidatus Dormibacteria bacterium]
MPYRSVTPVATQAVARIMAVLDELPTGDGLPAMRSLAVLLGTRRDASVLRARADGFSWGEDRRPPRDVSSVGLGPISN